MAKLLSGTRIYGTANVDTSVAVGSNAIVNVSAFYITGNTTTAPTAIFQGANLIIGNTSITGAPQIYVANSTGNVIVNTTSIAVSNTSATPFLANTTGLYHTGTVNAASYSVGTSFTANSTVVNAIAYNVGTSFTANSTVVNAVAYNISTTLVANTLGVYHTGTINAASHTVGTSTVANSTGVYTGVVNAATHSVSTNFIANSTQLTITIPFSANGGVGTSGQVLTSNGATGSPYWAAASGGGGGFTNGQSIMVSNIAFANSANTARAYSFYNSNTNTLDTVFI
jgi:translation initiation factor 6 (eIF-6)